MIANGSTHKWYHDEKLWALQLIFSQKKISVSWNFFCFLISLWWWISQIGIKFSYDTWTESQCRWWYVYVARMVWSQKSNIAYRVSSRCRQDWVSEGSYQQWDVASDSYSILLSATPPKTKINAYITKRVI